jgi:hypothetical protein
MHLYTFTPIDLGSLNGETVEGEAEVENEEGMKEVSYGQEESDEEVSVTLQ